MSSIPSCFRDFSINLPAKLRRLAETYQMSFLNVTSRHIVVTLDDAKICFSPSQPENIRHALFSQSILRGALKQVTSRDILVSQLDERFQTEKMIRFNCIQAFSRKSSRSKKIQGRNAFLNVVNKSSVSQTIHSNYGANDEIHKVVLWNIFIFSHEEIAVMKPHRWKISWSHNLGLQHRIATSWNVCFAYMLSWEKFFFFLSSKCSLPQVINQMLLLSKRNFTSWNNFQHKSLFEIFSLQFSAMEFEC